MLNSTFAIKLADRQGAAVLLRNSILAYTPSAASDYAAAGISGTTTNLGNNNLIQVNDGFAGGIVSSAGPLLSLTIHFPGKSGPPRS